MAAEVGAEAPAIYIPFHVYNREDITASHKMMYGLIVGLSNEKGYCYAKNGYMAKALGLSSADAAGKHISTLMEKNLVKNIGTRKSRMLVESVKEVLTDSRQNGVNEIIHAKMASHSRQNGVYKPIIYIFNNNIGHFGSNDLSDLDEKKAFSLLFDHFWNNYDRKVKRSETEKLFSKLNQQDLIAMLERLGTINAYYSKENKTDFVPEKPHPTTFLRNRRWEDECFAVKKNSQDGAQSSPVDIGLNDEMRACVARFVAASNGDETEMLDVDHAVMDALDVDMYGAIDIINVDGLPEFKEKLFSVWGSLKVSA